MQDDILTVSKTISSTVELAMAATREAERDDAESLELRENPRQYFVKHGVDDFSAQFSDGSTADFFDLVSKVPDESKVPVARTFLSRLVNEDCNVRPAKDDSVWLRSNSVVWTNAYTATQAEVAANAAVLVNLYAGANAIALVNAFGSPEEERAHSFSTGRAELRLSSDYLGSQMFRDLSGMGYSKVRQSALLRGLFEGRLGKAEITTIATTDNNCFKMHAVYKGCDLNLRITRENGILSASTLK
jgi:hypothetical protein